MTGRLARCMAVACGAFSMATWAAPVVTVGSATVHVGESFDVPISISGIDDGTGLTSWQFDVSFDPAIVSASTVTEGPFLAGFGTTLYSPGVIDNGTGTITLVTDAYVDLGVPTGSGVLETITFMALGLGNSALSPANVFLDFSDAGFTMNGGSVVAKAAASVPEPGNATLMLCGLLLLAPAARRLVQSSKERSHPQ